MKTKSKLYVFVLMPFSEEFNDVYQLGIKAACDSVGVYCERVDETHVLGPVYDKITNAITKADIVISDLSNSNPNVYYETGFAHALSKITIHLCQDIHEIPFDLHGFQHIVYSGRIVELKERLEEKLLWAIEFIEAKGSEIGALSFDFYQGAKKIDSVISGDIQTTYRGDGQVGQLRTSVSLDILNTGSTESQTLGPVYVYSGPEVFCVSSESDLRFSSIPVPSPSDDPEFHFRHKVDFRQKFASSEWISLQLVILFRDGLEVGKEGKLSVPLKLRFLTESTPIDFPLTLEVTAVSVEPPTEFLIDGDAAPSDIDTAIVREFSRDGSIEEAGFQLMVGIANKSSQEQKVGPIQIHTIDLVKKFDSSGSIHLMTIGSDRSEASQIDGFSRKFTLSDIFDLDPFAYENGVFSFELDVRKISGELGSLEIPMLIRLFTQWGPKDTRVTVKVQD